MQGRPRAAESHPQDAAAVTVGVAAPAGRGGGLAPSGPGAAIMTLGVPAPDGRGGGPAPSGSGAAVTTPLGVPDPDGRGGGLALSEAGDGGTGQNLAGTVETSALENDSGSFEINVVWPKCIEEAE